ncbi:hypothetical protein BRADI_1g33303v3 [Brachypodium distachyon]|uniref:Uncharacterized protein n=1 Tax=Brachypodium distachyon TaxID=15368 RepID=A0A0Q3RWU3_BRADI|nr:hypothetical protein BRADI_1g33303v3 [Brachypodium distachyon]
MGFKVIKGVLALLRASPEPILSLPILKYRYSKQKTTSSSHLRPETEGAPKSRSRRPNRRCRLGAPGSNDLNGQLRFAASSCLSSTVKTMGSDIPFGA